MRKLLLLFIVLAFVGCSSNKKDEQMISDTIKTFYNYLNNKDYKKFPEVISPNMSKELDLLTNISKESVRYSSVKVESVEIIGEKAVAKVSTTDEFNNNVSFTWNLIKIKNLWKIDYYSKLNNNSFSKDEKYQKIPNKEIPDSTQNHETLTLPTNIEEQNTSL